MSGGQAGADRAALDAALEAGLEVGGWCPPDAAAEDGPIPARYGLRPTPTERAQAASDVPRSLRTEWNVRDSDATLILWPATPDGEPVPDAGSAWTRRCAERLGRPWLAIDPAAPGACDAVTGWLDAHVVHTLNVAGPSESAWPGLGETARALLRAVLRRCTERG